MYALTRKAGLVKDFGLCGQIQRAAVSVMSNLAEGFERLHRPEKLQFYHVARSSCGEVRSLLCVIVDNYPTLAEPTARWREEVEQVVELVMEAVFLAHGAVKNVAVPGDAAGP